MKIEKNKIIECTESELWNYWYYSHWSSLMDYETYRRKCIYKGTKIVKELINERNC